MLEFLNNCSLKANTIQKLCLLFINLTKKIKKSCHKVSPANELPPGQSSCCSRLLTWPPHSPAVTRGNMRASALADHPPSLLIFLQVCAWWVLFQIFVVQPYPAHQAGLHMHHWSPQPPPTQLPLLQCPRGVQDYEANLKFGKFYSWWWIITNKLNKDRWCRICLVNYFSSIMNVLFCLFLWTWGNLWARIYVFSLYIYWF